MRTDEFDYELPAELIAAEPLNERDLAGMMVVRSTGVAFEHGCVRDIGEYLDRGDLLVLNDTRVIPARLTGHKQDTGGAVEILLVEEIEPQHGRSSFEAEGVPWRAEWGGVWDAIYSASRPPRPGAVWCLADGRIHAEVVEVRADGRLRVKLNAATPGEAGSLGDILEVGGIAPVPPYVERARSRLLAAERESHRADSAAAWRELDNARYQTVYAKSPGAIAAPTAGLHFTTAMLEDLRRRGVDHVFVTLHVGPGTFQGVEAELVEDHRMEDERYRVSEHAAGSIAEARQRGSRVVAVGTTTVRTLETVAAEHGRVTACSGRTRLFIRPPYEFKAVDALLTNFHLPRSPLFMMVSAFARSGGLNNLAGRDLVLRAYREAMERKYRFYSYGDCMLIL